MNCSLIICTYNWPEALGLVLSSAITQAELPNEIIVADDGSDKSTAKVIQDFSKKSIVPTIHSWQEDYGFRAAKSRNKAIAKAYGDYIILIDGDIILHPKFIQDHIDSSQPGYFIQGSRVLITQERTRDTLTNMNVNFSFFSKGINNFGIK